METWGIEGMSPNYLERRGWSRNTIKVGDKLSITFHPLKNGDKGGSSASTVANTGELPSAAMSGDQLFVGYIAQVKGGRGIWVVRAKPAA